MIILLNFFYYRIRIRKNRPDPEHCGTVRYVFLLVQALVHEHAGNQAILTGLRREGVADSVLLTELGLELTDDGKIKHKVTSLPQS